MKKNLLLSAVLMAALFTSCGTKDETTPTPTASGTTTTTPTYLIYKDSVITTKTGSSSTEVRKFLYNSSKKLIKVEHKNLPSASYTEFDTLIYNGSGQLITVKNYSVGNTVAHQTSTVSYNGSGQLTSVVQLNTPNSITTFSYTYTSGKITGIIAGNPSTNGVTISNIVYNGDNVVSLIFNGDPTTATFETTAANPYYGLNFDPFDFVNMLNKNNMLMAYSTADPTSIIQNTKYTYVDGRVATSIDTDVDTTVTPAVTTVTKTYITYKAY
jgi:YD repeat-containing protein